MKFSDSIAWDTYVNANTDPYGKACVDYARDWAELMEYHISKGDSVAECAKAASHDADTESITGFMYGAAVSMLAKCWKYGEELRRWHNEDAQLGDEGTRANETGGVLNPALMVLG